MSKPGSVSKITRNNWLLDATLLVSAIAATITGIYFLYFPVGGYQGGRNPMANITIIFSRHTWDDLHTWGGISMMAMAAIHVSLHWHWVVNMTRRMVKELIGNGRTMNQRGRINLWVNIVIGGSFLITAVSGIYFLFLPGGRGTADPMFLLSRPNWDLLHTWGGIALILAATTHFAIHWNWIAKVSRGVIDQIFPGVKRLAYTFSDPARAD